MTLWILDTDCLSLFQRRHPQVTERVSQVAPEEIAVTIITVEEQFYGRLNRIRRADSDDALILAYARLRETVDNFNSINVLDFDRAAATQYANLVR